MQGVLRAVERRALAAAASTARPPFHISLPHHLALAVCVFRRNKIEGTSGHMHIMQDARPGARGHCVPTSIVGKTAPAAAMPLTVRLQRHVHIKT